MEGEFLTKRRAELTSRAEQRGIDWKAKLRDADLDDDGFMVAALASFLDIDIQRVFDPEVALDLLERDSARIELEKEMREEAAHPSLTQSDVDQPPGPPPKGGSDGGLSDPRPGR